MRFVLNLGTVSIVFTTTRARCEVNVLCWYCVKVPGFPITPLGSSKEFVGAVRITNTAQNCLGILGDCTIWF
jgi:hypothetical protein